MYNYESKRAIVLVFRKNKTDLYFYFVSFLKGMQFSSAKLIYINNAFFFFYKSFNFNRQNLKNEFSVKPLSPNIVTEYIIHII